MILWACTCGVDSKHTLQLQCIPSVALAFKTISLQSTLHDSTSVTDFYNHSKPYEKIGMQENAGMMHHLEHL